MAISLLNVPDRPLQPPDSGSLTTEQTNKLQAKLESIAIEEAQNCASRWIEFIDDHYYATELASIVSGLLGTAEDSANTHSRASRIEMAYIEYRVTGMEQHEIDAVARELFNDWSDADE
jgi:hypothetical protein